MALESIGSLSYDNLVAGDHPIVTETATLLTGSVYAVGSVLGKITTGGKLKLVDSTQTDGSEDPYAVLLTKTDASTGDKVTSVALCGEFVSNNLVFGGTDTITTHKAALRALSIYAKNSVAE